MAVKIVTSIQQNNTEVNSVSKVEMLFDFITPLVKDIEGAEGDGDDEVRSPCLGGLGATCLLGVHQLRRLEPYFL
jgi:hypothetical protein